MGLYLFPPAEDPGPDFAELLRRARPGVGLPVTPAPLADVRQATTIAALRYSGGVVMAGDRRATEGVAIAHRAIEKVFPADRYSAVAIAGAAGPAIDMVRLFQVQLEHYEKVEGAALTLEGKANQLAQLVRDHLPMAMQGLGVVPLFADRIKRNLPIPITDPNMTRFLLSLPEAVETALDASENGKQGELWVRRMPAATVRDLAEAMAPCSTRR